VWEKKWLWMGMDRAALAPGVVSYPALSSSINLRVYRIDRYGLVPREVSVYFKKFNLTLSTFMHCSSYRTPFSIKIKQIHQELVEL